MHSVTNRCPYAGLTTEIVSPPTQDSMCLNLSAKIRKEWFDIFNQDLLLEATHVEMHKFATSLQEKWEGDCSLKGDCSLTGLWANPGYPVLESIKKVYGSFNFESILQNEEELGKFLEATRNDLVLKLFIQLGNPIEFQTRDELTKQIDSEVNKTRYIAMTFPSQNGTLPLALKFLPHLEQLSLYGCNLQTHPLSSIIDSLKELKLLIVPLCRLENIPEGDITKLPNLCLLDLTYNCFDPDKFPAKIGNLTRIDLVDSLPDCMKINIPDKRGVYVNVEQLFTYLNQPDTSSQEKRAHTLHEILGY